VSSQPENKRKHAFFVDPSLTSNRMAPLACQIHGSVADSCEHKGRIASSRLL
jgi:hypothetical protein